MAETVHLYLKSNGADIKGESTQTSLGRADSIECLFLQTGVETAREKGSGMATGRRTHKPLIIRKRIDKSSPLLMKALCSNEVVAGEFKFFRPNPTGDGTTQHFYSIEIGEGRIASITQTSPDSFDPALSNQPEMEEVGFVFHNITWTYTDGGISHHDNWREAT